MSSITNSEITDLIRDALHNGQAELKGRVSLYYQEGRWTVCSFDGMHYTDNVKRVAPLIKHALNN